MPFSAERVGGWWRFFREVIPMDLHIVWVIASVVFVAVVTCRIFLRQSERKKRVIEAAQQWKPAEKKICECLECGYLFYRWHPEGSPLMANPVEHVCRNCWPKEVKRRNAELWARNHPNEALAAAEKMKMNKKNATNRE